MNLFLDSHQELLARLLENHIDFIIIGGYSVIFHGYKRTTADVDIWLKPDNGNRDKLVQVLYLMGFEPEDVQVIAEQDFTKPLVFSLGEIPEKVDFLTKINNITYLEAAAEKIIVDIDGLNIPFLHLNHLVLSKFNTGRAKDQADIEELQKLNKQKRVDD